MLSQAEEPRLPMETAVRSLQAQAGMLQLLPVQRGQLQPKPSPLLVVATACALWGRAVAEGGLAAEWEYLQS